MYSRGIRLKDCDDLDRIFNLDYLDGVPQHRRNFEVESSDSAVGTESQVNNLFGVMSGNFEGPSTSLGMTIRENGIWFPITQEESISSSLFTNTSINITSRGYEDQSDNLSSSNSFLSSQEIQTPVLPTPLSKLSLYSLMQRSLMRDNVQRSNIDEPMIVTEENDTVSQRNPSVSPFLSGGHQERQKNSNNPFESEINEDIYSNQNFISQDSFFNVNTLHQHDITHQQSTQFNESQGSVNIQSTSLFGSYKPPPNIIHNVTSLPKSIINLYRAIKSLGLSDCSFVHALSAQTCQEFLPMAFNTTLKKSLLLSIASIDTELDHAPIPIIALGRDCSSVYSIMNNIGNYAQRYLAPTDQIFNVSINSEGLVEVGPVFLAFDGVCYLGDWSRLATTFTDEIKIIIDSGKYFINQTKENVKLGSAIWTYWCLTGKHNKDYSNVAAFVKYFGMPIVIDSDESDEMIEFLLEEATNGTVQIPNDVFNISYEDMKSFLNIIRNIKVQKSVEAQKLLKAYFDTIQIDRKGAVSVKGFQIIQQMSESFAKLSLRSEVLICDVEAAISIAEETFLFIIGETTTPRLHSPSPRLQSTQDIQIVEQYFMDLHVWLENYTRIKTLN